MQWKGLAILTLWTLAQGSLGVWAQTSANPGSASQSTTGTTPRTYGAPRPASATSPYAGAQPYGQRPATPAGLGTGAQGQNRAAGPAGQAGQAGQGAQGSTPNADESTQPQDATPQQITVATPAPAPAAWPWQDRIAWIANILLAVFACVGVYVGLSLLKKIDRQTQYAETAAQSAAYSAQAALLHAQAIMRTERPWILVTVEPSGKAENRFMVVATNRGRGPARIVSAVDRITTEVDQAALPGEPDYEDAENNESLNSVILLPGESTGVKTFGRDEVREFCGSEERFRRIEKWEEVILLYGKIVYEDLVTVENQEPCETAWCCWYIHGRQNSGMVMAGPPPYNRHT
jgi:hypothetical protein